MTDITPHISLDIETWGTSPGCQIRSVGAVKFDLVNGVNRDDAFYVNIGNQSETLWRDPGTEDWWNDQSESAQNAFDDPNYPRYHIDQARAKLLDWACGAAEAPSEHLWWTHGASFDIPILQFAFDADVPLEDIRNRQQPWYFRKIRDTRTLFDISPTEIVIPNVGTHHNALDDAIAQAEAIINAMGFISQ